MLFDSKHDLQEWARPCPLTLTLSPNTKNVLGEREQIVEMLTRGGRGAPAPRAALGYFLMPFQGSQTEEAASCRFTNVQSPDSRFRGNDENLVFGLSTSVQGES
jgi:hypothetical protein